MECRMAAQEFIHVCSTDCFAHGAILEVIYLSVVLKKQAHELSSVGWREG